MLITTKEFGKCITRLFGPRGLNDRKFAIALSGGVDSMCLTYLLVDHLKKNNLNLNNLFTITIDHSLRDNSHEESKLVKSYITEKYGIKSENSFIGKINWEDLKINEKNFENLARIFRYKKINEICASNNIETLFVGHTANDQVETYLMRKDTRPHSEFINYQDLMTYNANRIFGTNGIKEISEFPLNRYNHVNNSKLKLYRPLINCLKTDLIETYKNNKWFEDSTNQNEKITKRNLVRKNLESVVSLDDFLAEINKNKLKIKEYEKEIENLKENITFCKNKQTNSIFFKIPSKILFEKESPIINRFFYESTLFINSIKKPQYKFLKFFRLQKSLCGFSVLEDFKSVKKLDISNLIFKISKSKEFKQISWNDKSLEQLQYLINQPIKKFYASEYLNIEVFRKPPPGYQSKRLMKTVKLSELSKDWINYDNRFFFKFVYPEDDTSLKNHFGNTQVSLSLSPPQLIKYKNSNDTSLENISEKFAIKTAIKYQLPILSWEFNGDKEIIGVPGIYLNEKKLLGVECIINYGSEI